MNGINLSLSIVASNILLVGSSTGDEVALIPSQDVHDFFGDGSSVVLYQFNGSSSELNGMNTSAPTTTYSAGVFGQSANFTGGFAVYSRFYLSLIPTERTYSAHIKTTHTSVQEIIEFGSASGDYNGERFYIGGDGKLYFSSNKATNIFKTVTGAAVVNDGVFHHVSATLAPDGLCTIRVDGEVDASGYVDVNSNSTYDCVIGGYRYNDSNYRRFTGSMDQVRVFNRAISHEENTMLVDENRVITLGEELVSNSDIDSSVGWTVSAGATIDSGNMFWDGTGVNYGSIRQTLTFVEGKTYRVRVNLLGVYNYTQSGIRFGSDTYQAWSTFGLATTGIHDIYYTATADSSGLFRVYGKNGFTFRIDSVSIKEVL